MTPTKTPATKTSATRAKASSDKDRCIINPVAWAYIPDVGRGVIATKNVKKGTILERSPVVVGPAKDFVAKHGKMTVIDHYLLTWEEKGEGKEFAMGLGYLMLYNHSDNPNAEFKFLYKKREIEMIALRDIKKGEEVTHDYGGEGVWFETREKKAEKAAKKKVTKKKK